MRDSPRWLTDEQQAVWQDLLTTVVALPSLLDRQLEQDAGVSNFEYSVLARLSMAERRTMRLSTLATICDSSLPRMSKVMVRFEKRGWVVRRADPDNGRYTLATLTDEGMRWVVESAPGHVERVRRLVFDPLTPQEQEALGVALSRVATVVRRELNGIDDTSDHSGS